VKILREPAVRERFAGLGLEAAEDTPEQFAAFVKAEVAKWARVSKTAGVTPN
jgi:tripartite-type tricarboxylate transporter receptor subunit TctC